MRKSKNNEIVKKMTHDIKLTINNYSSTSRDSDYHEHMMNASLHPEEYTTNFIMSKTDSYWQVFWAYVAFLKLGKIDNAAALLPRVESFGGPEGDVQLLRAITSVSKWLASNIDYYRRDALHYLDEAVRAGLSMQLPPLWQAALKVVDNSSQPESEFRFYYDVTLKPSVDKDGSMIME